MNSLPIHKKLVTCVGAFFFFGGLLFGGIANAQLGVDFNKGELSPAVIELDDESPAKLYACFNKAMYKGEFETAVACLSDKGRERLFSASIKARQIVERLSNGPFPDSLSKKEAEKLRDWSGALSDHYDQFEVGIKVNSVKAEQLLSTLKTDEKTEYLVSFLKTYTGKAAPKAFRDRMKTLWYSGRLKARNKVTQSGDASKATMDAALKKKFPIEFSQDGEHWRLDGADQ